MNHARPQERAPGTPGESPWIEELLAAISCDRVVGSATPATITLQIARLSIELQLFGGWIAPERMRSVGHLERPPVALADLTIAAWENDALWPTLPEPGWYRSRVRGLQAFIGGAPPSAEILDASSGRCFSWVTDAGLHPLTSVYRPFGTVLASWLPTRGISLLHAAAVGDATGAVLLVGPSGAGKSTTSLVCSERGLPLLADDFCAVDASCAPIRLHSLFRSVKLRHDSATRLAGSTAAADGADEYYRNLPSERVCVDAPLVAVVVVRPDSTTRGTSCAEVPFADRLELLSSTGLMAGIGGETTVKPWLRAVHAMVRQPTYRLSLGWDLDGVAASVMAIRDRHAVSMDAP